MSLLDQQTDWQYKHISPFDRGLNADDDPSIIEETELVQADNVTYDEGILKPVDGYAEFNSATSIRGNPRKIIQYTDLSGSERLVLVTNATFYERVGDEWHYTGDGNDTTLDAAASASDTIISVADATGFTASEHIGIQLDDGSQHQTTIASVDGTGDNITLDDAMPSAAAIGNTVVQAPALGGLDEEYVDHVVVYSQDWLVITNGVDNVKRFDGTNLEDVPNLPSSGSTVAKLVELFGNRLCLLRTTEGANKRPHRFRWSAKGDPTDWSGADAGFADLIDTEDLITASGRLGPYLVIYKESSIVRVTLVETSSKTFEFPNAVIGEGAMSPGAVAIKDDEHILVGRFGIYRYAGGRDLEPIGEKVFRSYISSKSQLNRQRADRIFSVYVGSLDEVWIFLVTGSNNYPDLVLRKQLEGRQRWVVRKFTHKVVDLMEYSEFGVTTYNDLAGTSYQDLSGRSYNSFSAGAGNISLLFCSPDAKTTYRIKDTLVKDAGTSYTSELITRDFGNPHFKTRMDSLDIEGRSNTNVEVHYSTDRGGSWLLLGTFNTSNQWAFTRMHQQLIFQFVRFRFRSTGDATFALKGLGLTFMLESNT